MTDVIEVRAPVENVNDEAVAVIDWLVENGSLVEAGTPIVLAETTKTSFDIAAPASGFVWQVARAGTDVAIGAVLCYIGAALDDARRAATAVLVPAAAAPGPPAPAMTTAPEPEAAAVPLRPMAPEAARPLVPRLSLKARAAMAELRLPAAAIEGRGLVRARDLRGAPTAPPEPGGEREAGPPALATRVERLARSKRVEARRLRSAWANTVPSSVTVTVPSTTLFSETAGDGGGMASATLIAEVARLLRVFPLFNARSVDGDVHYYQAVNVGYALNVDKGLNVIVIHDADRKSVSAIAEEKQRLLVDYLDEGLALESLSGATFTITDLSGEGVSHFVPVLNEGQAAILGVCAAAAPGVAGGAGGFNLILVFDHQLSDGRTAAAFLRALRDRLAAHDASMTARTANAAGPDAASCALCFRSATELDASRHFLVRTVGRSPAAEQTVCTICLQDWYS